MTSSALAASSGTDETQLTALSRAAEQIAPSWPLDRWIAVNPWWGMKAMTIEDAEARLRDAAGVSLTMPAAFYEEAWASGRIQPEDLSRAIAMRGTALDESALLADLTQATRLERAPQPTRRCASAWELAGEAAGDGLQAAGDAFDAVAECCADYFDHHQQRWETTPDETLYGTWRTQTRHDRRLNAVLRGRVAALPADTAAAREMLLDALALSPEALESLAHTLLLRVNGWASWCQGLAWHTPRAARHAGIDELLVVLLAWEWLGLGMLESLQRARWQAQWASSPAPRRAEQDALWCWQTAYELGYQRQLSATLTSRPASTSEATQVQAAFCIDVRSERLRRHLESASPEIDTLGVAGFFGMPITHASAGPERALPRVPGLLTHRYRTEESPPQDARHRLRFRQEARRQSIRHAKYHALSTFTLVETTGLAWGWKLLKDSIRRPAATPAPTTLEGPFHAYGGEPLTLEERIALARGLLDGLALGDEAAPLLVLVGHDSQSDNNPHHAGLACGACGGQGGGVNARLAARLLNDAEVRRSLAARGAGLPDTTHVLAATHCTLTDRVTLLDTDAVPQRLGPAMHRFEQALEQAGRATREERAMALGVEETSDEARLDTLKRRGGDWSQPRPEWGLANNAALLLAPRALSRGLDLEGRVFLHEYDPQHDDDGSVLEALMTAPMLVASWINLQYYASVAVPSLYGAGNKLLHSVVGGHVGVIEGNSPQLRTGLPLQSLHDGTAWRHEPLRLSVVIDAPRERIEAIVERQPAVAELVHHRWLWLCRHTEAGLELYTPAGWQHMV
ncbi:putative inorganic carbon transporter subunit DabA [Halomonas aquatica]|uniref:Probable inorganic carbon transporter subunit DabA n=1 Tax=Halomonas aquatica TaxID=3151123 RepID=A0ABV1NIC2_9GAMM